MASETAAVRGADVLPDDSSIVLRVVTPIVGQERALAGELVVMTPGGATWLCRALPARPAHWLSYYNRGVVVAHSHDREDTVAALAAMVNQDAGGPQ